MNARLLLNLFLLIGIAAAGLFIINSPDKDEANIIKLGGPEISEIKNILIQSNGLPDVALEKDKNDKWFMSRPYKAQANSLPISEIIKLTGAISHSRFSAVDKNLRAYDLLPAKASVHLNETEYAFGNIEHINKRRYILKNNMVHLTTDLFYHRLRTNAESFIRPQLLPDDVSITRVDTADFTLNQTAQGEWMVSGKKSFSDNMATDAIQILLDHWQHKRATKILPTKPTDSSQRISIALSDNSEIQFAVVKNNQELILIRSDLGFQYHLPTGAADDLLTLQQTSIEKIK